MTLETGASLGQSLDHLRKSQLSDTGTQTLSILAFCTYQNVCENDQEVSRSQTNPRHVRGRDTEHRQP